MIGDGPVFAHAFALIDECVADRALALSYKRIVRIRALDRNGDTPITLCEIGAWLDEEAERSIKIAYALRVADYPRTRVRVDAMLSAHDRLKATLQGA